MDTIRVVYTVRQTQEFQDWLDGLVDTRARARIVARVRRIELGTLGDWKAVGRNVSELRVDVGPGYRLYFTRQGRVVIVLLIGGDKSSQRRDVHRAQQMARLLESQNAQKQGQQED